MSQSEKLLKETFSDPKNAGSFGSVESLYKAVNAKGFRDISRRSVKQFLTSQDAYTIHVNPKYRFKKRMQMISYGYLDFCQADLCEMQQIAKSNNGVKFLLVVVEVLSNFMWVHPLKTKKATDVAMAFEYLFTSGKMSSPCKRLQTDEGTEFMSQQFKELMKKYKVIHFQSHSRDVKASIAEVHIRELKRKIYKYMTDRNTKRYIDVLFDIVVSLNERFKKKIKMKPVDVNYSTAGIALKRRYPNIFKGARRFPLKFKFKVGDNVRIALHKEKLRHGYLPNFSEEVFIIRKLVPTDPPCYELDALNKEAIEGRFYVEELIKVSKSK